MKRYYGDTCFPVSEVDFSFVIGRVHELYTHWVVDGYLERDFLVGMDYVCNEIVVEYIAAGCPVVDIDIVDFGKVGIAKGEKKTDSRRFIDELGAIDNKFNAGFFNSGLKAYFLKWVKDGWHPRDFISLVKDCSAVVHYDHICLQCEIGSKEKSNNFLKNSYKT